MPPKIKSCAAHACNEPRAEGEAWCEGHLEKFRRLNVGEATAVGTPDYLAGKLDAPAPLPCEWPSCEEPRRVLEGKRLPYCEVHWKEANGIGKKAEGWKAMSIAQKRKKPAASGRKAATTCSEEGCTEARYRSGNVTFPRCHEHHLAHLKRKRQEQQLAEGHGPLTICVVPGCDEDRYVAKDGKVYRYCQKHQQEAISKGKRSRRFTDKAAALVKQAAAPVDLWTQIPPVVYTGWRWCSGCGRALPQSDTYFDLSKDRKDVGMLHWYCRRCDAVEAAK